MVFAPLAFAAQPLALHPDNQHYFLFRGKPAVLITSGEHYGAVLNLDFDYGRYLKTLAKDGLNGTRTWAGAYCEPPSAFNIASNTLAPLPGRFTAPWARSDQPGYANGGNRFDLTKWDQAYFTHLAGFMSQASKHGIIVEMNLFCPFYEERMWELSPMNAVNNINGVGAVARTNVYTLDKHGGLLAVQEAMVRKLVTELKRFDNLYYEICNEPYFGGVTLEWQRHIAEVIVDTERELGVKHLISQNIANGSTRITDPDPLVSIFNFHYSRPPDSVAMNYSLNRVIGMNETGFDGSDGVLPWRGLWTEIGETDGWAAGSVRATGFSQCAFQCIRPFGLRGKWPPDHQHVSSSLSKIPYGGFSPVRLQTGIQPRPSSTMPSLSARPAFTPASRIYTRLKSLSPKRALFRSRTCVQSGLPLSSMDHPVQRSLAPQRVVLSHRIIAYYDLIRASLPLPPVYVLSSGSLPFGPVWAGNEKVPNLSRSAFPIVPSSVPRRLGDCIQLLLHRPLWPFPSSHKVGARLSTLGRFLRGSCNEAAKFALCYGPMKLLALLRQGRLLSSFHLLGHPWGVSNSLRG